MKTVFICSAGVLAAVLGGCIDFEPADPDGGAQDEGCSEPGQCEDGTTTGGADDDDEGSATGDDTQGSDDGCGGACGDPHGLSGEVMLFVNSRLSSEEAAYTSNTPLERDGTFLGPAIYLYDPARECTDGTNACRVVKLGSLLLDASLGEISVEDGSLAKFTLYDLAWSAARGLWSVSFDVRNDEWGLARLTVPDWSRRDNEIGVERWAIKPGAAASPSTDPCYWQEAVSGLGFVGDTLLLGVRGLGGVGLSSSNGYVFRVALDVLEQGYCVHPSDISQDPHYYACEQLCEAWTRFEPQVGIAGDVDADATGEGAFGLVRSEADGLEPQGDRIEVWQLFPPSGGQMSSPVRTGAYAEDLAHGLDIEGLAWVGGQLYGINVYGKVFVLDPQARSVVEHDDIGPLFGNPLETLRIRGATGVTLPE